MHHTIIPQPVQNFVVSYLKSLVGSSRSSTLTLVISDMKGYEGSGIRRKNELYFSAQIYLSSKISPDASKLRMTRDPNNKNVNLYLSQGEVVSDVYKGIELKWRYLAGSKKTSTVMDGGVDDETVNWECFELNFDKKHKDLVVNSYVPYVEKKAEVMYLDGSKKTSTVIDDGHDNEIVNRECYELSFDKKHRDLVVKSYVPYVERKAKVIKNETRIIKMHSYSSYNHRWESVNFEHPSTFDTMAMTRKLKSSLIKDLDRFIERKDYYKKVGNAWKRGYLLYGPPGTGKSSLVAAMANYLKFDIYVGKSRDANLRRLLLATNNSSILLVEDIDCSVDLPTRLQPATTTFGAPQGSTPLTLSGLLNCIDGLWSSCGDERIVIFTTNNREKLDPALLRPGRMDMHIYLGHCSFEASNYLGLSRDCDDTHRLYPDIKRLIDGEVLTPAQVDEELMKNEDADVALEGLVKVLKRKRSESEKCDDESKRMKMIEEDIQD